MKAAVCHEFGKPLVIEELDIDPPKAGEVKVRLSACAICHSDIHYAEGAWGGQLPAVYGHEAAGVVEQVGADVRGMAVGDHVIVTLIRSCGHCYYCAQGDRHICETKFPLDQENRLHGSEEAVLQGLRTGAFAEYVVVDQSQLVKIPKDVPLDSAALLACGVITGLGAVVNTAKVPSGSSVVVIGTGGVGLNAVQGARLCGAHPIIAVDLAEDKLPVAKSFGATDTINPKNEDAAEKVKALTGGRGADYIFVTVGSTKAMEQGLSFARPAGTLVIVGMPAVGEKFAIEALDFADASQRIIGSKMGSTRLGVDIPKLVSLYQQGQLKLDELISGRYPLEEINEAIASVNRAEALRNIIVFDG
ncbi:MAG: Zn-dependent alcohol dehydrogenase [Pseudomonadota bacterium]